MHDYIFKINILFYNEEKKNNFSTKTTISTLTWH